MPRLTPTESDRHQLDTRRLAVEESRAERFATDPQGRREIGAGRPIECTCNLCCYARKHPQFGAAPHVLCGCGGPVETPRRAYAIPTCYACLPPPEPLPVAALTPEPR